MDLKFRTNLKYSDIIVRTEWAPPAGQTFSADPFDQNLQKPSPSFGSELFQAKVNSSCQKEPWSAAENHNTWSREAKSDPKLLSDQSEGDSSSGLRTKDQLSVVRAKMGLCKCPKRKVTNQFCFEHRVNVCEHCIVQNHPKVNFRPTGSG